jgi:hypothetical protein
VIVAKNGPRPARTYSFIEPAFGIIVASSEKLITCAYITTRARTIAYSPIVDAE